MPCHTNGEECQSHREREYPRLKPMQGPPIEAAFLCAVLTVTDSLGNTDHILRRVDSKISGVDTAQIMSWWMRHKESDRKRIEAENLQKEAKRLHADKVAAAMAKLTDEEKALLRLTLPT